MKNENFKPVMFFLLHKLSGLRIQSNGIYLRCLFFRTIVKPIDRTSYLRTQKVLNPEYKINYAKCITKDSNIMINMSTTTSKSDSLSITNNQPTDSLSAVHESILKPLQELDSSTKLRYIAQRSTQENINSIQKICDLLDTSCRRHGLIPDKPQSTSRARLYNYLVSNTWPWLRDDPAKGILVTRLPGLSVYLFGELVHRLHLEPELTRSLLYHPIDLVAEVLETLPRYCLDFLDFDRALKFVSEVVGVAYKRIQMMNDEANQSEDLVRSANNVVAHLSELVLLFNNERFLRFEELKKSEIYRRKGVVMKILLRTLNVCFGVTQPTEPFVLPSDEVYKLTLNSDCPSNSLPEEKYTDLRAELDRQLIGLLLSKMKEIDTLCYLEWSEFDDADKPSWTLQQAVGVECRSFLTGTTGKFDNPEYELLAGSLVHIKSTLTDEELAGPEELCQLLRTRRSKEALMALWRRFRDWDDWNICETLQEHYEMLNREDCLQLLNDVLALPFDYKEPEARQAFERYVRAVTEALSCSSLSTDELRRLVVDYAPKFLGEREQLLNELLVNTGFLSFLSADSGPELDAEYRAALMKFCFQPVKSTLCFLPLLNNEDGNAKLTNNLNMISDMLKLPVPSGYDAMLQSLLEQAKMTSDEKEKIFTEEIMKLKAKRPPVPLCLRALQKLITTLSLEELSYTSFLKTAFDSGYVDHETLTDEFLIPNLLQPCENLNSILEVLLSCSKVYKPTGELYRKLLLRLRQQLPLDRSVDRHVSDYQTSCVQLLYSRSFGDNLDVPIADKISRYAYQHRCTFSTSPDYPVTSIAKDVLRHELLCGTAREIRAHFEDALRSQGKDLLLDSGESTFEVLFQLSFEACLLSLEFPETAPPNTTPFLLEHAVGWLLGRATPEIIPRSLRNGLGMLEPSVKRTPAASLYEKLIDEVGKLGDDELAKRAVDLVLEFARKAGQLSEWIIAEPGPRLPFAVKLYMAERAVESVSGRDIADLTLKKFNQCFSRTC